jgi:hypothetical protein
MYECLNKIIYFIDKGDWARAKHHWLSACLNISQPDVINKTVTFDCTGSIYSYFVKEMEKLQQHQIIKASCDKVYDKTNVENISKSFKINSNDLKYCGQQCGKCSVETIVFEDQPLWLIHELNENDKSTIESFKNRLDLIIDNDNKYKLLCIYQFIDSKKKNVLNHFNGIFYLNSKFFLIDNLSTSSEQIIEISEEKEIIASCLIYYKKV